MKIFKNAIIISALLTITSLHLFAQSEVIFEFESGGKKAAVTMHQYRRLVELSNSVLRNFKTNIPAKDEISELANVLGLMRSLPPNIQFRFSERDIEFWSNQMLNTEQLKLEFMARKAILEAAYFNNVLITTQDEFDTFTKSCILKFSELH